jgi:hypothetical protein
VPQFASTRNTGDVPETTCRSPRRRLSQAHVGWSRDPAGQILLEELTAGLGQVEAAILVSRSTA